MKSFFSLQRFTFILALLFTLQATLLSADYLEVTAPGNQQIRLAIAVPIALEGYQLTKEATEIKDVLTFDMTLAGLFTVIPTPSTILLGGIRSGEFTFAPWQGISADLLLLTGYRMNGTALVLEFRLYDVVKQQEISAKRFSGVSTDLRLLAHSMSDEIMRLITGKNGPFSGKIAFVANPTGNKEIYLMDYDGFNILRLTKNRSINLTPDFSPSGRDLLFTSYQQGNPQVFRRNIATGIETRLTQHKGMNMGGAWSPDGKAIALSMSHGGNADIYLMNDDGKEIRKLTSSDAIDISPAWSPDGTQLAYVSDRLGKPQVFIMKSDGSGTRRLTTNGKYNVSPRWSPNGDRIAYCRQVNGGFQIFAVNPDGTGDTQLTFEGSNEYPRWSPDGRFITFSSTRSGTQGIYVMRRDGSGQTSVLKNKAKNGHPVWSPS